MVKLFDYNSEVFIMENKDFIEAGRIVNTHGIAGEVKIEVWLDNPRFLKSCKRVIY